MHDLGTRRTTPTPMPASSRLALRLDVLSRDQLLELAAGALDELPNSHQLRGHADALVAARKPLPAWCVDSVLLSPDLLPHLIDSLSIVDGAAASVCSAWSAVWLAQLRRRRYIHPVPKLIKLSHSGGAFGVTEMPDGALCVTSPDGLNFMNAQGQAILRSKWAALAQIELDAPTGVQVHQDALLVVVGTTHVRRLRLSNGEELARSPLLGNAFEMTVAGDELFVPTGSHISVLNVATLELLYTFGEFDNAVDCAVCDGELYVADLEREHRIDVHGLNGQFRRTVHTVALAPSCISIRDNRIYILEEYHDAEDADQGGLLFVLDLNGNLIQKIDLREEGVSTPSFCFRGTELLIVQECVASLTNFTLTSARSGLLALRFI